MSLSQAHPEKYILKRSAEFRAWLKMLRDNGKYLYVITGSHFDFASHVASYALGDDWKDLFDIVIFFARKPSFFWENRPFWRLEGPKEVESLEGWEDLETGDYYSQGRTLTRSILFTSWACSNFVALVKMLLILLYSAGSGSGWLARCPPRLTRTSLPLSGRHRARHPRPFPPPSFHSSSLSVFLSFVPSFDSLEVETNDSSFAGRAGGVIPSLSLLPSSERLWPPRPSKLTSKYRCNTWDLIGHGSS